MCSDKIIGNKELIKKENSNNEVIREYINTQTSEKLDLERVSTLKDNAMLKAKPELWCIWNFEKNDALGFDIWKMTKGLKRKAIWYCDVCDDSFRKTVNAKTAEKDSFYCPIKKVNHSNSLATKNPKLASQWHPTKNGELTPFDVTCGCDKKVWWVCEKGHEWDAIVCNRINGRGCPYCSNRKVFKGYNDMWTTNPELASMLANPEDGYKYMQSVATKLDWKCSNCGEIIKNKPVHQVKKHSLPCAICSDGISYPEKFMYNTLRKTGIEFDFQKTFDWSDNRIYDFIIYHDNTVTIVETHGGQHYNNPTGYYKNKGKSLQEEQANDQYKYHLALTNGIKPENYIVIDCRRSELDFIKNNIINSRLAEIFNLSEVDWDMVNKMSLSSFIKTACDYWNSGVHSTNEISKLTKLSNSTILKYLKLGANAGICNYSASKAIAVGARKRGDIFGRKVICLNTMEVFNSIVEARDKYNSNHIGRCCNGKQSYSGKHPITKERLKWMYKEDYEKCIENHSQNNIA